jgi:hypothetical protein
MEETRWNDEVKRRRQSYLAVIGGVLVILTLAAAYAVSAWKIREGLKLSEPVTIKMPEQNWRIRMPKKWKPLQLPSVWRKIDITGQWIKKIRIRNLLYYGEIRPDKKPVRVFLVNYNNIINATPAEYVHTLAPEYGKIYTRGFRGSVKIGHEETVKVGGHKAIEIDAVLYAYNQPFCWFTFRFIVLDRRTSLALIYLTAKPPGAIDRELLDRVSETLEPMAEDDESLTGCCPNPISLWCRHLACLFTSFFAGWKPAPQAECPILDLGNSQLKEVRERKPRKQVVGFEQLERST